MSFAEAVQGLGGLGIWRRPAGLSIATRLSLWFAAITTALALLVGIGLYLALVSELNRVSDDFLTSNLDEMRTILTAAHASEASLMEKIDEERDLPLPIFVRLADSSGWVIRQSSAMPNLLESTSVPPPGSLAEGAVVKSNLTRPDGGEFRVLSTRITGLMANAPATWTVQLALDDSPHMLLLARYAQQLILLGGVSLVAAAFAGYRIVAWQLQPLRRFSNSAAEIDASTLDRRVELSRLPIEVRDFGTAFNLMLDRLEASYKRLDQCSDNLAHELRTPLNQIMLGSEIALRRERSAAEYRRVLDNSVQQCRRLVRIVEGLTFLARADETKARLAMDDLDVGVELRVVRDTFGAVAQQRGQRIALDVRHDVWVRGDSTLLQQAIGNLVSNALRHSAAAGSVTLCAKAEADFAVIEVADNGEGIAPEHLPYMFDRFYFARSGRAVGEDRIGLGLSLTESIVQMHGGTISVTSTLGSGSRIRIVMPSLAKRIFENDVPAISASSEGNAAGLG